MSIRFSVIAALTLAVGAYAQNPGPGRGPMGRFGPEMTRIPGDARLMSAVAGPPGRVVRNAPYSADQVTETTQLLADGNKIHQVHTSKVFRDSDGRVRTEQTLGGLGPLASAGSSQERVIFINDPVAGTNLALNVKDRSATRSSFGRRGGPEAQGRPGAGGRAAAGAPPGRPTRDEVDRRAQARPNEKTESLGRQSVEGIMAEGTRTVVTVPAGQIGNEQPIQIVSEVWYSPELQTVVLSKHTNPSVGDTVYRLSNVSRAEPAATLFQAPADYKVTDSPGGRGGPRW
jgi:hypothetical protein